MNENNRNEVKEIYDALTIGVEYECFISSKQMRLFVQACLAQIDEHIGAFPTFSDTAANAIKDTFAAWYPTRSRLETSNTELIYDGIAELRANGKISVIGGASGRRPAFGTTNGRERSRRLWSLFFSANFPKFDMGTDGSLNGHTAFERAYEFRSIGGTTLSDHMAFFAFLKAMNVRVNSTCGGHVHVGFNTPKITPNNDCSRLLKIRFTKRLLTVLSHWQQGIYAVNDGQKRAEAEQYTIAPSKQLAHCISANEPIVDKYNAVHIKEIANVSRDYEFTLVEFRLFSGVATIEQLLFNVHVAKMSFALAWSGANIKELSKKGLYTFASWQASLNFVLSKSKASKHLSIKNVHALINIAKSRDTILPVTVSDEIRLSFNEVDLNSNIGAIANSDDNDDNDDE